MIQSVFKTLGLVLITVAVGAGLLIVLNSVAASTSTITSSVIVENAMPIPSAVFLNNASAITLTPNATTTVVVNFTVTDDNGCSDVFTNGNVTTTVFRSGVGSACTADSLNCYILSTTTHNCAGGNSANATSTFSIYYFAQATDGDSSFPSEAWQAQVFARDASSATGTATSSLQELNTLTAINVTTSSINYGTVSAGTDTASINQVATSTNAGNSSTTLRLYAQSTLTFGTNSIATSSQRYSTSTFTYPGTSTALTDSAVTVSGFFLTAPTSTNLVSQPTFWGLQVPGGTATGTYSGVNVFASLFQP
ncbi:MAG: hypothetical protein QMD65_02280 [Patescibacteria group bacterium]|nr:hypothetical protein [Patescibacteria group bacterium]